MCLYSQHPRGGDRNTDYLDYLNYLRNQRSGRGESGERTGNARAGPMSSVEECVTGTHRVLGSALLNRQGNSYVILGVVVQVFVTALRRQRRVNLCELQASLV